MQYLDLVFNLLFLGLGIYLYLFSIRGLRGGAPEARQRAEQFRRKNARWLRVLSLLLMAIMFFNVILSLRALL